MTTDKECNSIAKEVYRVDSSKVDNPIKDRDTLASGKYKILKAEDNPDNGMQVRTVGAIKGGEVGKNYIVIVYAGINHLTAI
ncbi:TPA: hypothetical protein TUO09_001994 [Streptococcus equi subsp. zooepidemicus]|nr:hypothetical protein [Streptococcus equi subsp. zooepidemicus]HEL0171677.1 hypothetical protein [Streptococcus equi subsp. zooepidemicus]HEL0187772.1 hypothetical protein [Streptococcus equi subsp. zooepidemicus]HEL0193689.1 hypothetical protein [Streptococcus equi subsp. zooepidemicus]HEL0199604.1 hypothetical protein [Streptococcus equi subsp. zooepidemicus]